MLTDITEYYTEEQQQASEEPRNRYIGICDFELCGLPILEGEELINDGKIYCSKYHKDEQILYEKECE